MSKSVSVPLTLLSRFVLGALAWIAMVIAAPLASAVTVPDPVVAPATGTYNHPVAIVILPTCIPGNLQSLLQTRIHFTVDGSEPTENSTEYLLPFIIADSTQLRVRAFCPGMIPSREINRAYQLTFTQVAARPQFSPAPGAYTQPQAVTLSCTTPGSIIRYTTNGSIPTLLSPIYSQPIIVASGMSIRARAWKLGLWPSGVSFGQYTLAAEAVTITPPGATLTSEPTITMQSSTQGAVIRYTTDGSAVSETSPHYTAPFQLTVSGTIKARAFKSGFSPSATTQTSFELAVAPIAVQPPAGAYANPIAVSATSATGGVTIRMTQDGTAPTDTSPILTQAIPVSADTTLKFRGFRAGWTMSPIEEASYTFPHDTVAPVIVPASGTYFTQQTVSISTASNGAQIHLTTDGSEPTSASPLYTGPLVVAESTVIKAIAIRTGWTPSGVTSSAINLQVPSPTYSVPGGTYDNAMTVALNDVAAGSIVRFSVDGSVPEADAQEFPSTFLVDRIRTLTVRAFRSGWTPSAPVAATYSLQVAPVSVTPPSGASAVGAVDVTLTSTTSDVLYRYATDGSNPLSGSLVSNGTISLTSSSELIVVGTRPGFLPSEPVSRAYTVTPTVRFAESVTYIQEGVAEVLAVVTLSAVTDHVVSVSFSAAVATNSPATPGSDFTLTDGVVTIPAGILSANIPVVILNDQVHEDPEMVVINLSQPEGAVLADEGKGTVVIVDEDPQPTLSFASAQSIVSEVAGGIDIPVALSSPSQQPITVRVLVDGGTATAGTDFRIADAMITFAPLQTIATLHVEVLADQLAELTETAIFRLASQTAAGLGAMRTHTVSITSTENPLVCLEWNQTARYLVASSSTDPAMASRVYALLSVAQYRAARVTLDDEARPAAVATASCEALSLLFPTRGAELEAQLVAQRNSASWPGAIGDDVSTDAPGRAIGRAVVQAATSDGADARWAGVIPVGPGYWYSSWTYAKPPTRATWGQVRPWFMTSGAQFRPGPPPAFGSPAFQAALTEVRTIADARTEEQLTIAGKWSDGPGSYTPPGHWNEIAATLIAEHHLSETEATRVLAVMNAAQMDAGIATWDAKFTYWLIRPYQADLAINTPVGQPNFPSYTSGHSAFSGAAAAVLAAYFPTEAGMLTAQADEAAISRLYGGIHYRFDNDVGLAVGRNVGALAVQEDADGLWRADAVPEIVISSPRPGALLSGGQQPTFAGMIRLRAPALTVSTVQALLSDQTSASSIPVSLTPTSNPLEWSFVASPGSTLADGIYTLRLQAIDDLSQVGHGSVTVGIDTNGSPVIAITAPADHALLGRAGSTTIVGTVNQPLARLTINGTPISFTTNGSLVTFAQSMTVEPTLQAVKPLSLVSGQNDVEVMAVDLAGLTSLATIHVDVDAESPVVHIETPTGTTARSSITVAGAINDVVLGTVNRPNATVTVNGVAARVVNRTFLVDNIPLALGANQLTAVATDAAGNQATHQMTIIRSAPLGAIITLVSGDRQAAPVGTLLPQPIVVRISDQTGQPLENQVVQFKVVRGDGVLQDADDDVHQVRSLLSDANGLASARWMIGSRAGLANQRLAISALGSPNTIEASADTTPGAPELLSVIYGDQQTGAVGALLPYFLRVRLTDSTGNPIAGTPISFSVTRGTSSLSATRSQTSGVANVAVESDTDGFGTVWLTLGSETDDEEHLIEATAAGYSGQPITLRATARVPGLVEATALAGQVLNGEGVPVAGATVVIDGTTIGALSDAMGNFLIRGVPPGERHVTLNGATASTPLIRYPTIGFEFTFVPGIVNTMPRPFYLPEMDISGQQWAGGNEDVILEMPGNPDFKVKVFAHSTIRADGARAPVRMYLNQVNALAVPMAPQGGAGPVTVSTLQPSGTRLDPPAQIIAPNLFARPPGAQYDVKVFDHDLGEFVSYGLATVDADGSSMVTDLGVGYGKAGWGFIDIPLKSGDAEGKVPKCTITNITGTESPRVLNVFDFVATYESNVSDPAITWSVTSGSGAKGLVVSGQGTARVKIRFDQESVNSNDTVSIKAQWLDNKQSPSEFIIQRQVSPLDISPSSFGAGDVTPITVGPIEFDSFDGESGDYFRFYSSDNGSDVTNTVTKVRQAAASGLSIMKIAAKNISIMSQSRSGETANVTVLSGNDIAGEYDIAIDLAQVKAYSEYGNLPPDGKYHVRKALATYALSPIGSHRFGSIHTHMVHQYEPIPGILRRKYWAITDQIGPNDPNYFIYETAPESDTLKYRIEEWTRLDPEIYNTPYIIAFLAVLNSLSGTNYTYGDLYNLVSTGYQLNPQKLANKQYWQSPPITQPAMAIIMKAEVDVGVRTINVVHQIDLHAFRLKATCVGMPELAVGQSTTPNPVYFTKFNIPGEIKDGKKSALSTDLPPKGPSVETLVIPKKYFVQNQEVTSEAITPAIYVTITAELEPENLEILDDLTVSWSNAGTGGPDSSNTGLNGSTVIKTIDASTRTATVQVTSTGLSMFRAQLVGEGNSAVTASILLPRAGGELKQWCIAELGRIRTVGVAWVNDCFEAAFLTGEDPIDYVQTQFAVIAALYYDYQGLPTTVRSDAPTPRYSYTEMMRVAAGYRLNQASNGDWDEPAYGTLFGTVIHRSKLSNYGVAVLANGIGFTQTAMLWGGHANQLKRTFEWDGPSSQASLRIGWDMMEKFREHAFDPEVLTLETFSPILNETSAATFSSKGENGENNDVNLWPETDLFIKKPGTVGVDYLDTPHLPATPLFISVDVYNEQLRKTYGLGGP